jgi:hypothetical protein
MAYNKKGDGRAIERGHTRCDVMPVDGEHKVDTGPNKANAAKNTLNNLYRKLGTNLARAEYQRIGGPGKSTKSITPKSVGMANKPLKTSGRGR